MEMQNEIDQKKTKTSSEFVYAFEENDIMTDAKLPNNDQLAESVGTQLRQSPWLL